jgi:hypothetical protein
MFSSIKNYNQIHLYYSKYSFRQDFPATLRIEHRAQRTMSNFHLWSPTVCCLQGAFYAISVTERKMRGNVRQANYIQQTGDS